MLNKDKITVPRFSVENGFKTTESRSKIMSNIKSKDTKYEVLLRKELWKQGHRYLKNTKTIPGKPDIVFTKRRLVVFVDGDFWHGFKWEERKKNIKTNTGFWIPKIERNIQRDEEVNTLLKERGYTVLRFWENELKRDFGRCLETIKNQLK